MIRELVLGQISAREVGRRATILDERVRLARILRYVRMVTPASANEAVLIVTRSRFLTQSSMSDPMDACGLWE